MKLFILTNNPNRASFRQRVEVYLDTLRTNGIDCEVVKLPTGPLSRHKVFRRAAGFDGVFLHKKKLNPFDAHRLRKYSRKIIYNFDDAIMFSDKRPDYDSGSHLRPWRRTVKLADMVITGSSYLAALAQKFNSNVKVLPIGLEVRDYKIDCPPKTGDKIRLVWIGSKSTLSYLAGIKQGLEEIGSRFDNVILRIISDDFLNLENMPVEKYRWSKDRRVLDLVCCDIGLAPLPNNRFTQGKCSFKVLEYAAAGLPVVASPVGTNSDYVRDGVTGFFATEMQQWIDKISQLVENPQLQRQMGQQGRSYAENFDTRVIGKHFVELIKSCLQS